MRFFASLFASLFLSMSLAATLSALALTRSVPLIVLGLIAAGCAWTTTTSTMNVAVQLSVPAWVQARALESQFRVTLFDLRGHARSPAPEGAEAYRLPALLADLGALVEAAGTPVILGGLSLGAKLALDYFQRTARLIPTFRDVQDRIRRLQRAEPKPPVRAVAVGADDEFDRAFDDILGGAKLP